MLKPGPNTPTGFTGLNEQTMEDETMKTKNTNQPGLAKQNESEYRKLKKEHHRLEIELKALIRHKTLTPIEESEKKRIQIEKLHKKDRMEGIIRLEKGNMEFKR